MNLVDKPYAKAFLEFARDQPRVLCVSADLTSSCEVDGFRDRFPERFFSMEMTEQNMLSVCGGLALEGFRPFVHTFAVFLYRRKVDQLVNSIAYPKRKVRLIGCPPGLTTPRGVTHQAIEAFDASTNRITVDPLRAEAFEDNLKYYSGIFTDGNKDFAIQKGAQSDPAKLRQLTTFFFWTAWASAANLRIRRSPTHRTFRPNR